MSFGILCPSFLSCVQLNHRVRCVCASEQKNVADALDYVHRSIVYLIFALDDIHLQFIYYSWDKFIFNPDFNGMQINWRFQITTAWKKK